MNLFFDKIYVLSLITNKSRQEFIKYQFNELNINFEFVYGVDYYNFDISWPLLNLHNNYSHNKYKDLSCTMTHYQAVMQAYYLGYNNVLIIEDDVCLNIDRHLFEDMFNNIPKDADFVSYEYRHNIKNEQIYIDYVKNNLDKKYIKYLDNINVHWGAAMYAIMNRETMQKYIDEQHKCLRMSDEINNIFQNITLPINKYLCTRCLFVDQYNYNKIFNNNNYSMLEYYDNIYLLMEKDVEDKKYTKNDFYEPTDFHFWSRDQWGPPRYEQFFMLKNK